MKSADERLRKPSAVVPPPPRPARRHPTIESRPAPKPVEEVEEGFDERVYSNRDNRRDGQRDNQRANQGNNRRDDRSRGQQSGPTKVRYTKEGDKIIFRIHQTFIPVAIAYIASIIASLLIAAVIAWLQGPFWMVLGFAIICFFPAISRHISLLRTVYILTETKVEIQTGFFSIKSSSIPLRHILDVSVSERFVERLIGIGDIEIDTASADAKITLDNINNPRKYEQMILDQLNGWD
jgi:membrane protein YdbS with pleckstrin-like domain